VKRSGRIALLVMGTLAVGGGAYALMPRDCEPNRPGVAASASSGQTETACNSSSGHSSGWSSRSSYYGGDSSSSHSSSESGSGAVTRGGFGGFAHAISAHFSGG
jgi:hypothetical protein